MELMTYRKINGLLLLLLLIGLTFGQPDSLRSALNAVDRRQKEFTNYPRYDNENLDDYGYTIDGFDQLAFLPNAERTSTEFEKNPTFDKYLSDYYEQNDNDVNKRISSSFRERLEDDKKRQLEDVVQNILTNPENDNNDDYNELLKDIYDYYRNYPTIYNKLKYYAQMRKRSYNYPKFGLDSIGLRKRNFYDTDYGYQYYNNYDNDNYYGRDDNSNNNEEYDGNYYDLVKDHHTMKQTKYDNGDRFLNYPVKRFPVSKRSSNYKTEIKQQQDKRASVKKQSAMKTDPKVAKELSNIFGATTTTTTKKSTTHQHEKKDNHNKTKETPQTTIDKNDKQQKDVKKSEISKEKVDDIVNEKPLEIKKKSIDWSDYFGLDRRKKSDNNLENEWLMGRYHKATALNDKRNNDYPLQSFKHHEQMVKKDEIKKNLSTEEMKLTDIDTKLKNMEDAIIDDTLKYTGSNDGAYDAKQIQQIKDRVISRLAAAYNLEKMRRALEEYKSSIAKERERLKYRKNNNNNNDDDDNDEKNVDEKRVSIPRKQAIDEDREKIPESDNNIKCAKDGEDCQEQNYRTPTDILELASFDECSKIQKSCNEVGRMLGEYGRVFETACNMHQMCLLCNNNSWYTPTRQCNVLFMAKSYELCDSQPGCQKEMRRSLRYLMDVGRSLKYEPLTECELTCPDRQ